MNRYRINRELLIEIYNKRDKLIKSLCVELDEKLNIGTNENISYYNHLRLMLDEIEGNIGFIPRENCDILPFPPKYNFVQSNFGFSLPISGQDMTTIHSFGYFEPTETVLIQRISEFSNLLIDVGANIGYFSLLFKQYSEHDSKVYAFEPEKLNFHKLKATIERNNFVDEIIPYELAVSNENTEKELYINKRGSGGHSLHKVQPEIFSDKKEIINTVKLDDFIETEQINANDCVLKIDIEGAEIEALEGAYNLLQNRKPIAILIEIWKNAVVPREETIKKLLSWGYTGYSIQKATKGKPLIQPILLQNNEINVSFNDNYIFFRDDAQTLIDVCLQPLKWHELVSDKLIEYLLTLQEHALLQLSEKYAELPKELSNYCIHYISASDGGYPVFDVDYHSALKAYLRFHHNSGGPAVLSFINKNNNNVETSLVVGESEKYKSENGHYNIPPKDLTKIVTKDIEKYRPDFVLLMPNNATSFTKNELEELKSKFSIYLAARDGDACAYSKERISRNLQLADVVDHFISVDGEFVENAIINGFKNVEYIPSFTNKHYSNYNTLHKKYDILFAGYGGNGLLMDNGSYMYSDRRKIISEINDVFGERLFVIGKGYNDLSLKNYLDEFIGIDELQNYIAKAKILLAHDGPFLKGFTSVRIFRAINTGTFVLIKYFPGIENLFVNHKHIVWYHGNDEAINLIRYYLDNEEEREKIATQGKNYLSDMKGWRRKSILIDYLMQKSLGNKNSFAELYGDYSIPKELQNHELLLKYISVLKSYIPNPNLFDLVIYAELQIKQNNLNEAKKILTAILEYDRYYLPAFEDLVVVSLLEGDEKTALEFANEALLIERNNSNILDNLQSIQKIHNTLETKLYL